MYRLRLGPLSFTTVRGDLPEQIGDGLDPAGPVLIAAERKPVPFKLVIPVRGDSSETDPKVSGQRLRRQVRQLLSNPAWLAQGIGFAWSLDNELDCWLQIGSGEISDGAGRGLTQGEWLLELSDCYLVARPGSHRAGRKLDLGDRRGGLVARDTFGRLYSTDYSSQAAVASPLVIPGLAVDAFSPSQPAPSLGSGPLVSSKMIYQTAAGVDGDVMTYEPDATVAQPGGHISIDDPGQVRVWDVMGSSVGLTVSPPAIAQTAAKDLAPDTGYGWERVLGPMVTAARWLAIENDMCRVRWAYWSGAAQNVILIEQWDDTNGYVPVAAVTTSSVATPRRISIAELTPERAVIDVGYGSRRTRIILQRGWPGPRIEQITSSTGVDARLDVTTGDGTAGSYAAAASPAWVTELKKSGTVVARLAQSHTAVTVAAGTSPATVKLSAPAVLAVQISGVRSPYTPTAAELASLSLTDAQSVPVLVER